MCVVKSLLEPSSCSKEPSRIFSSLLKLGEGREIVGAPSPAHMCKTIVMENQWVRPPYVDACVCSKKPHISVCVVVKSLLEPSRDICHEKSTCAPPQKKSNPSPGTPDLRPYTLDLQCREQILRRPEQEIGILLPNNQRHNRTSHIQKDVLPYALC